MTIIRWVTQDEKNSKDAFRRTIQTSRKTKCKDSSRQDARERVLDVETRNEIWFKDCAKFKDKWDF